MYPFTHFAHPPSPPASGNQQSVLCIYEFGDYCFVLDFRHKWDQKVLVLLVFLRLNYVTE